MIRFVKYKLLNRVLEVRVYWLWEESSKLEIKESQCKEIMIPLRMLF
jgi:hypothetical protein